MLKRRPRTKTRRTQDEFPAEFRHALLKASDAHGGTQKTPPAPKTLVKFREELGVLQYAEFVAGKGWYVKIQFKSRHVPSWALWHNLTAI